MIHLFVIVLVVVLFSFIFLGFNLFLRKKPFPETEIGRSKAMRERGISCPRCDEMKICRKNRPKRLYPEKLRIVQE